MFLVIMVCALIGLKCGSLYIISLYPDKRKKINEKKARVQARAHI